MHRSDQELGDPEAGGAEEHDAPAAFANAAADERADERAGAEAGGDDPERPRPRVERVLREQRQQDVEVEADGREDDHHREDHPDGPVAARVAKPSRVPRQSVGPAAVVRAGRARRRASRAGPRARRGSSTVLIAKHQPAPNAAISTPASAGPKMRARVEEARVERDRVRQLVAPDHLEREVLARRRVEDERGAGERGDRVDLPQLDVPEQRDRGEHGGEDHLHRLRDDHGAAVVEAVGDDAGEQPEHRERPEAADASTPTARPRECGASATTSQARAMFCIHVPATDASWPKKKRR